MTDSKIKTDKNDAVEKSVPLSIGQQLRAAREEQGLSIEDVARHLLLSKQLINEIENDDYRKIPAPVYINGYLRSYAQLLKMPASSVLRVAPKATVRAELDVNRKTVTRVVQPKSGSKIDFFSYVVIAVFVLLALFWWRTTRVHSDVTPATINSTMTELQLPSAQPPLADSQQAVLPQTQDNNLKPMPQQNAAKIE